MSRDPASALHTALAGWLAAAATPNAATACTVVLHRPGRNPLTGRLGHVQADRLADVLAADTAAMQSPQRTTPT